MADINIEDLRELLEAAGGKGLDELNNLSEGFKALREAVNNSTISLRDAGKYTEVLREHFKKLKDNTDLEVFAEGFKKKIFEIKDGLDSFGVTTEDMIITVANLSKTVREATISFNTFDVLGKSAAKTTDQVSELTSKFSELTKNLSDDKKQELGLTDKFLEAARYMGTMRDAATNMQNAFLENQAAAGKLDGSLGKLGETLPEINNRIEEFNSLSSEVGNVVGLSSVKVGEYYRELNKIPGTMEGSINAHVEGKDSIHELEAALLVARGTHQDYGDVISQVDSAMSEFGLSTEEALGSISKMFSVTQSVGLKMNDVASFTKNLGNAFKFLGDTSESAGNNITGSLAILEKLTPELKKAGLGADAATDLVQGFVNGIANMSTAQKAFLSGQTGGPGGLLGGLQIEQMLAEDDIVGVASKVQQTLEQQVGGELITREQALERGEAGAQQFEFQRQLLQQGPFGSLASTPEGASSLIEALQRGDLESISEMQQTGEDPLQRVVKDGNDIAQKQLSELTKINNRISEQANSNIFATGRTFQGIDSMTQQGLQENFPQLFNTRSEESELATSRITLLNDERVSEESQFQSSAEKILGSGKELIDALGLGSAFDFAKAGVERAMGQKNEDGSASYNIDNDPGFLTVPTGTRPAQVVERGVEDNARRMGETQARSNERQVREDQRPSRDKLDVNVTVQTKEGDILKIVDTRLNQSMDSRETAGVRILPAP